MRWPVLKNAVGNEQTLTSGLALVGLTASLFPPAMNINSNIPILQLTARRRISDEELSERIQRTMLIRPSSTRAGSRQDGRCFGRVVTWTLSIAPLQMRLLAIKQDGQRAQVRIRS